ncbi:unnamed protein product [Vitrella brassicaformis CCMP3155]|uniref:Uncharacterized protein n=1 Tax=Vitrella brassicaformis (strain CCMP3155) TaxID=1169540 RepID=A0A0G4GW61_VITBC|nr:unnamed protein product [Vitrella brassicaformis CCMP3155]|eukprot:CEM35124.1 unnamed protein product [Vitrella brassicaformis CCMP3155]
MAWGAGAALALAFGTLASILMSPRLYLHATVKEGPAAAQQSSLNSTNNAHLLSQSGRRREGCSDRGGPCTADDQPLLTAEDEALVSSLATTGQRKGIDRRATLLGLSPLSAFSTQAAQGRRSLAASSPRPRLWPRVSSSHRNHHSFIELADAQTQREVGFVQLHSGVGDGDKCDKSVALATEGLKLDVSPYTVRSPLDNPNLATEWAPRSGGNDIRFKQTDVAKAPALITPEEGESPVAGWLQFKGDQSLLSDACVPLMDQNHNFVYFAFFVKLKKLPAKDTFQVLLDNHRGFQIGLKRDETEEEKIQFGIIVDGGEGDFTIPTCWVSPDGFLLQLTLDAQHCKGSSDACRPKMSLYRLKYLQEANKEVTNSQVYLKLLASDDGYGNFPGTKVTIGCDANGDNCFDGQLGYLEIQRQPTNPELFESSSVRQTCGDGVFQPELEECDATVKDLDQSERDRCGCDCLLRCPPYSHVLPAGTPDRYLASPLHATGEEKTPQKVIQGNWLRTRPQGFTFNLMCDQPAGFYQQQNGLVDRMDELTCGAKPPPMTGGFGYEDPLLFLGLALEAEELMESNVTLMERDGAASEGGDPTPSAGADGDATAPKARRPKGCSARAGAYSRRVMECRAACEVTHEWWWRKTNLGCGGENPKESGDCPLVVETKTKMNPDSFLIEDGNDITVKCRDGVKPIPPTLGAATSATLRCNDGVLAALPLSCAVNCPACIPVKAGKRDAACLHQMEAYEILPYTHNSSLGGHPNTTLDVTPEEAAATTGNATEAGTFVSGSARLVRCAPNYRPPAIEGAISEQIITCDRGTWTRSFSSAGVSVCPRYELPKGKEDDFNTEPPLGQENRTLGSLIRVTCKPPKYPRPHHPVYEIVKCRCFGSKEEELNAASNKVNASLPPAPEEDVSAIMCAEGKGTYGWTRVNMQCSTTCPPYHLVSDIGYTWEYAEGEEGEETATPAAAPSPSATNATSAFVSHRVQQQSA